MNLTKTLKENGYDLIESPVRNQKLLQLWLKTPFNRAELYYSNISEAFNSKIELTPIENPALNVNSTTTDNYAFNIGLSVLEDILSSLGIGDINISSDIKSGKNVSISYDNTITKEVPIGLIQNYLFDSDFNHPNRLLLKNANRNNILVVSGVLMAKTINVDIQTNLDINPDIIVKLNKAANGKLNFDKSSNNNIKMTSNSENYFPIAVKADRLDFDKGHFNDSELITDNRSLF
ncbi:MAG: hypothetical protein N4A72_07940 [Bacteroidales bacterium]|jgi:hypothetical protein|nr:hypothetical protein [Bacteroidales bacterium]